MELSFETPEIRDICEKHDLARKSFGEGIASDLRRCLAEAEAAETMNDLLSLYDDNLENSGSGLCIRFSSGLRVHLLSGHVRTPITGCGAIDWQNVYRVRIANCEVADATK